MKNWLFTLLLSLSFLVGAGAAQTNVTGAQVPDADAERMLFIYLGSSSPAGTDTKQDSKVKQTVTDTNDVATVEQNVDSFNTQYQMLSTNYNNLPISTSSRQTFLNNRDALVASIYNTIMTSVTSADATQFSTYVQAFKSNITTQILTDGSSSYSFLDSLKPYGFLPADCSWGGGQDCDEFAQPETFDDEWTLDGAGGADNCVSIAETDSTITGGSWITNTGAVLPSMTQYSVSPSDGTLIAVDSSGKQWEYAPVGAAIGAESWSQLVTGKTMKSVAVASTTVIYGLDSAGQIYSYTGNNTFTAMTGLTGYSYIAVTEDGVLWAAKGNLVYKMVNGSFALQFTDSFPIISLSATTANSFGFNIPEAVWVDASNYAYRIINTTIAGLTYLPSKLTLITINPDKSIYALDSNQVLYSYNVTTWTAITGHSLSYLATGGPANIVGLDATSRGLLFNIQNTTVTAKSSSYSDGTNVSYSGGFNAEDLPPNASYSYADNSTVTQYCKASKYVLYALLEPISTIKSFYERINYIPPNRTCDENGNCTYPTGPWCSAPPRGNIIKVNSAEFFTDATNPYVYWDSIGAKAYPSGITLSTAVSVLNLSGGLVAPIPLGNCTPAP